MRPLWQIAAEIEKEWANVHYTARPYLDAMCSLNTINDQYGADDGRSVVAYFLSNAATWRGEAARRIKKELKEILDEKVREP